MKGRLRRECLNCYTRRYRLIPENASTPATINVIGNHILTSAMLKYTKEAMIKITPIATVKIPNCLGMNHLKKRRAHHTPIMGCNQVKIYIWQLDLIRSTEN